VGQQEDKCTVDTGKHTARKRATSNHGNQ
jgi:hypothetical protein